MLWLWIISQAAAGVDVTPFMQLGAVGILGLAFLLLLRWITYQQSRELLDVGQALHSVVLTVLDVHKTLIIHDARIRRIHPPTEEQTSEEQRLAYESYERILRTLDMTADAIKVSMEETRQRRIQIERRV